MLLLHRGGTLWLLRCLLPVVIVAIKVGGTICPFRHSYKETSYIVWLKQTGETSGSIPGSCHFTHSQYIVLTAVSGWAWHSQLSLHIPKYCLASIVPLCCENTVVENKQQQNSEQWTVQGSVPFGQSLHLEVEMGQSQTCPAGVAQLRAMPPSPRTVCAFRLAEPPQRLCCHHQHFIYPERPMSYSPPYSPSLFKRPDRR